MNCLVNTKVLYYLIELNNGQKYVLYLSKKCHILINTIILLRILDGCKNTTIVSLGCVINRDWFCTHSGY